LITEGIVLSGYIKLDRVYIRCAVETTGHKYVPV